VAHAKTIAQLRQLVAEIAPASLLSPETSLPLAHPALTFLAGWPRPGLVEISGALGSGRLSLVLPTVATLTAQGEPVAVVDPLNMVYPPGWGVCLAQLLLVQPGHERALWCTEQLLRSGAFGLVLLLDPPRLGRSGYRLARAAEAGGSTGILLVERGNSRLPAKVRVHMDPGGPVVLKGRPRGTPARAGAR
jgi:hypothetical protein